MYLKSRFFTTKNGNKYEVVQTETGASNDVLSAIDTIRNARGVKKKMTRAETLKFIAS